LAHLAVDRQLQGKGLGDYLLMDALQRCWLASQDVGIVAVIIDPRHERSKAFDARYEFDALPDRPLTLWPPVQALERLFALPTFWRDG
jgi:GNAT superfamily N-acetyltransferase